MLQLLGLGVAGTFYQWFVSKAYKYAPASQVSIYSYTSIIFSSLLGILFWEEYLVVTTIAGIVIIVIGAYLIYHKDRISRITEANDNSSVGFNAVSDEDKHSNRPS